MKLNIVFHYEVNEQTGEMLYIGKDEMTVDTKVATTTKKPVIEGPVIKLEANKLVLSQEVVDMLDVCPDCRIDIKYKKRDKQSVPVIGTDAAFGTKAGNKLTKTNTISFRGAANEKLAQYGTTFTLEPTDDKGIFYMIGDANPMEPEDVPEETVNIDSELDIDNLETIDSQDLNDFNFEL